MTHIVLVCQNRACLKLGAASVLAAFQAAASSAIVVVKSPCLGQCGNGPMVRILPEDIWYWRVNATEVPAVIQRHLLGGQPIKAMLYPRFHSP